MKNRIPVAHHHQNAAMPSRQLEALFSRAGIVRGIETSVVLGEGADYLQVIAAIAEDGLAQERTPERRMLLDGIRTAITRTLALEQQAAEAAAEQVKVVGAPGFELEPHQKVVVESLRDQGREGRMLHPIG